MKCPYCNNEHSENAVFCEITGKRIKEELIACTNKHCQNFNKMVLPSEAMYCPKCGEPIKKVQSELTSCKPCEYKTGVKYSYRKGADQGKDAANSESVRQTDHSRLSSAQVSTTKVPSFDMGLKYENGLGVQKDKGIALYYYELGSSEGDPRAWSAVVRLKRELSASRQFSYFAMGNRFEHGIGVEKDIEKAKYYYRIGATNGDERCRKVLARLSGMSNASSAHRTLPKDTSFDMGFKYEHGIGVEKDIEKALYYYKLGASEGDQRARNALERLTRSQFSYYAIGFKYEHGFGVEKDIEKAKYYYRKGADQGNEASKSALVRLSGQSKSTSVQPSTPKDTAFDMGFKYENGLGVQKDKGKALYYYKLGASEGDQRARNALVRLTSYK